jgi:hypothetical protein
VNEPSCKHEFVYLRIRKEFYLLKNKIFSYIIIRFYASGLVARQP